MRLSALLSAPLFLSVVLFAVAPTERANTVTLPVIVYPTDGVSQQDTTITVNASDVSSVDSLYFQMHQPFWHVGGNNDADVPQGYEPEGAAAIRVNGGSFVDVTDANVNCAKKLTSDGCVAGAMNTIRFTIPASASGALTDGSNTITFRYNGTKGIRSGYRVLGVGFMTSGDPNVRDFDAYSGDYNGDGTKDGAIDNTTFSYKDPSTWTAPGDGDASNGQNLWTSRNILTNGKGTSITASCSDCHFEGGEDLKYFAYSNRSIISRARFHRLSYQQGEDIAAYIRSKTLTYEDGTQYDAPGRPWQPPFQPGPEMLGSGKAPDEGNEVYWMAGAGLEWVFDSQRPNPDTERDILAHIFPKNGDPANGVARYSSGDLKWTEIHPDSTIDFREIPMASQVPDWNNWLPDIHPIDGVADWESTDTEDHYDNEFKAAFGSGKDVGDIIREVGSLRLDFRNEFGGPNGLVASGIPDSTTNEIAMVRLSSAQWRTKILLDYTFNNTKFDEAGQWNCGYESGANKNEWLDYCEGVQLPGGTETIFRLGPHVNGTFSEGDIKGYGTREIAAEMTHLWYHLQAFVDSGVFGVNTVDWNYQNAFLPDKEYPLRSIVNYVFQVQTFSNKLGNDPESVIGRKVNWSWYNGGPKMAGNFFGPSTSDATWGSLSEATTADVLQAFWRSWYAETDNYPTDPSDPDHYPRDDGSENNTFNNQNFGPEPGKYNPPFEFRSRYYWEMKDLANLHESDMAGIIDTVATWGGDMWPKGNDRSYMDQYGTEYPLWDNIATASGSGSPNPSSRSPVWGGGEYYALRFPGDHKRAPNSISMKAAGGQKRPVGGNLNVFKFYVAAPPNSTPDSSVGVDLEGLRSTTSPGDEAGWQSIGGLVLASDTSASATSCEIRVRGGYQSEKAAVRTYITSRSNPLSSTTWFVNTPATLRQYYRGGYCVQEVNGTLIDSASVTLPDTARAVVNVVNRAPASDTTTTIMKNPSDLRFIKQK